MYFLQWRLSQQGTMRTHLCLTRYLTEQQEEHTCQDYKREFQNKMHLLIQLLLPTFLLGNQCM